MPATNDEQFYLELINDARMDPLGNAARYITSYGPLTSSSSGIQSAISYFGVSGSALLSAYSSLTPTAPVAFSETLTTAARTHNDVMIAQDTQSHQATGEASLGQRITDAGYTGWYGLGENIYAYSSSALFGHAAFMIDWGPGTDGMQAGAGHRVNIMNANWTEVGVGVTAETNSATNVGPQVVTQDFGTRGHHFVLGVAYNDTDHNAFYTPGEGRGDLQLSLGGSTTTSAASGGYTLDMAGLGGTVTLTGGGLAGAVTVALASTASNAKIDIVDGSLLKISASATISGIDQIRALGVTGLSLAGDGGDQHIFGTIGNDVLTGNGGEDRLAGGAGGDTLIGTGGFAYADYSGAGASVAAYLTWEAGGAGDAAGDHFTDIGGVAGSNYADILSGNDGNNVILGGLGNDWLFGRDGADVLTGGAGNDVLSGGGGADRLEGGDGVDVAFYRDAVSGIGIDVANPAGNGGEAAGDVLTGIENIWGSHFDDVIYGADDVGGQVYGFEGNDILDGRGGDDVFYGGAGQDVMAGGSGADDFFFLSFYDHQNIYGTAEPNEGGDTLTDFQHGVDHITVSRYWFGFGDVGGPAQALTSSHADFVTSGTATSGRPTFLYSDQTHQLYFDGDGVGAAGPVLLATLQQGALLTLSDIWTA